MMKCEDLLLDIDWNEIHRKIFISSLEILVRKLEGDVLLISILVTVGSSYQTLKSIMTS